MEYRNLYETIIEEYDPEIINCEHLTECMAKHFKVAEKLLDEHPHYKDYTEALEANNFYSPAWMIVFLLTPECIMESNDHEMWMNAAASHLEEMNTELMVAYERDKVEQSLPNRPNRLFFMNPPAFLFELPSGVRKTGPGWVDLNL